METTSAGSSAPPYTELAAEVEGQMVRPGDPSYDEARAVYNGMIDRHPAAIVRCSGVPDVVSCVEFARRHGVLLAVAAAATTPAGSGWQTTPS